MPEGAPTVPQPVEQAQPIKKPELYQNLQQQRAHIRHRAGLAHQEVAQQKAKEAAQKPPEPDKSASFRNALGLLDQYLETDSQETTPSFIAKLQREEERLQTEATTLSENQQERHSAITESYIRLFGYAGNAHNLSRLQRDLSRQILDLRESAKMDPDANVSARTIDRMRKLVQQQRGVETLLNEVLPYQDPESFLAYNLLKLRDYKRQYKENGIIRTEEVSKLENEIRLALLEKGLIALVGETGTGKTQLARSLASEMMKKFHPGAKGDEYEFVMGHRFTSRADLLSSLGVTGETVAPEQAVKLANEAAERYRATLDQGLTEDQVNESVEEVRRIALGQAENPILQTKEFEGAVFRAAEQGKVVIIDEFNYIRPDLIASLNELMQTKAGKTISTPSGRQITVQKGFGVIFTGNMSLADGKRYTDRFQLDQALINRLNSGMFEYNTPPLDDIDSALSASILARADETGPHSKRDLYQIGLTMLIDEKGNLFAPDDALEKTWEMAKAVKTLQNNFAGKPLRPEEMLNGSVNVKLEKTHASMRTFNEILLAWKADGYQAPLDYYIFKKLIRPASVFAPTEAAYMFDIFKRRGGFFQGEYWDQKVQINKDNNRILINGSIDEFDFQDAQQELKLFTPQQLAEAFSGYKMPMEIKPSLKAGQSEAADRKDFMVKSEEMQQAYAKVLKFIKDFGGYKEKGPNGEDIDVPGTLELFCQDEAAIMPQAA